MKASDWRGVFPALTTKFDATGALDFAAMADHLEFQLAAGVHGIIILGSLGENSTLSAAEKQDLIRFYGQRIKRRVPLVACIAESATRDALALTAAGDELGVDGYMVLPPMRYPSDKPETLGYLRAVAAGTQRPIMLYNKGRKVLLPKRFLVRTGI